MASKKLKAETDAARQTFIDSFLAGEGKGEEWEAVESGKNLKLAVGERVEGRIAALPYKAGKSAAFDIEVNSPEGTEAVTYWCPTVLTNLFKKLRVGDEVLIQCVGMIPTSNGDAYEFALLRKKR